MYDLYTLLVLNSAVVLGLCSFLKKISPTWTLHEAMTRKHRKSDSAPDIIAASYQNTRFHVKIHSEKMTQKCVGGQTKLGGTSIIWLVQIWSKGYNIILRCFWGNGKTTNMSQRLPVGLRQIVIWSRRTFWARWSTFEKQRLIIFCTNWSWLFSSEVYTWTTTRGSLLIHMQSWKLGNIT